MSDRSWTLLLHGGARTISPKQAAASRRGCLAAAWVGQRVLHGGGAALDAAIMDGATLDIGGVAAIRDVRHPVSVARSSEEGRVGKECVRTGKFRRVRD